MKKTGISKWFAKGMQAEHRALAAVEPYTRFTEQLVLISTVFGCTFFAYQDFSIHMVLGYGVMCLILIMCALRKLDRRAVPKLAPIRIAWIIMACAMLVSYALPNARRVTDHMNYMRSLVMFTGFILFAGTDRQEGERSMGLFFVTSLLFAVYVLFFHFFQDLYWTTVYPYMSEATQLYQRSTADTYTISVSSMDYTNYYEAFGMAAICGYLGATRRWGKRQIGLLVCAGVVLSVVVLGNRRAHMVALCGMIVFAFIIFGRGRKKWYRLLVVVGAGVLGLGALFALLPYLRQIPSIHRYVNTLEGLLSGQDVTSGRLQLWKWAIEQFREHPVFGAGWGRYFDMITPEFRQAFTYEAYYHSGKEFEEILRNTHNDFLQVLCETGVVGFALIIGSMAYCYIQTLRQFVRLRENRAEFPHKEAAMRLCGTSLFGQTFLAITAFLDIMIYKFAFLAPYFVLIMMSCIALDLEGYTYNDRFTGWMRALTAKPRAFVSGHIRKGKRA